MPLKQFCPPLLAAALALPLAARAQTAPADSATFLLHKFAQRIGKETYRLTRTAQAHTCDFDFKFVGLGMLLPPQNTERQPLRKRLPFAME